jgi:hypothetical protein
MANPGQQESEEVVARLKSVDQTPDCMMAFAIIRFAVWLIVRFGPGRDASKCLTHASGIERERPIPGRQKPSIDTAI